MSTIRNIGMRSEVVIGQLQSQLEERDDYIVVRTPSKPFYYFGNLLALKKPLNHHTKPEWLSLFDTEFREQPGIRHYTFSWTREQEDDTSVQAFTDAGFQYEEMHVLTQTRSDFVRPGQVNETVVYRPLLSDEDWQQWTEISWNERSGNHSESDYRMFLAGQVANYRQLHEQQMGEYLGAFRGAELIGFAGLFHQASLARFQHVLVTPAFQNTGIAKGLLSHLIERAPQHIETMVILADEHYHASNLYRSLGFTIAERECSLCWWPDENTQSE